MPLPQRSFEPDAACPLDGVRVIDLSRLVAGNAVSSQLADFGAEVIKIEDPQKGDPLRAWQTDGVSVHWKLYARNKKSVALSLRETTALNALRKANSSSGELNHGVLLACDTLVALEDQILGKPADLSEALEFLRRLSGRTHQVCSAVVVRDLANGGQSFFYELSHVTFRRLSARAIREYVQKINPLDKAGAYAAQAAGGDIISRIDGSFSNVVGLPIEQTVPMLRAFGILPRR